MVVFFGTSLGGYRFERLNLGGFGIEDRIRATRAEVLRVAKQLSRLGLVVSVWGNVSGRVRDTDLVVVTPSGVEYESLYEGMLPIVDVRGERVQGRLRPSSETKLHVTIYRARPDVFGVAHTHSIHASAFAVLRERIPALVEDFAQVAGGHVECAEYAPPGTQELADNVVKALGPRNAALLANHGFVGIGATLDEALRVCQVVEKGAQIYAIARALGRPALLSDEEVKRLRDAYLTSYGQKAE
jgi:L-fuculose-phosphate aldolase